MDTLRKQVIHNSVISSKLCNDDQLVGGYQHIPIFSCNEHLDFQDRAAIATLVGATSWAPSRKGGSKIKCKD